jgi:hypothetical protein
MAEIRAKLRFASLWFKSHGTRPRVLDDQGHSFYPARSACLTTMFGCHDSIQVAGMILVHNHPTRPISITLDHAPTLLITYILPLVVAPEVMAYWGLF